MSSSPAGLDWTSCELDLPESDDTVLIAMPNADCPIWPGYWNGQHWHTAEGLPVIATHWRRFPDPPMS